MPVAIAGYILLATHCAPRVADGGRTHNNESGNLVLYQIELQPHVTLEELDNRDLIPSDDFDIKKPDYQGD